MAIIVPDTVATDTGMLVITGSPLPTIHWQHNNGHLIVQTDQAVLLARFCQAHNPPARDFCLETIGRSWSFVPLAPTGPGTYSVPVPAPGDGWTAYFVDLIYPGVAGVPQTYSTSIFISPDTLPYEVTDPLLDPRRVGFWRRQVIGKGNVRISADVLAGYLPIPLFDQYVNTIDDAKEVFTPSNRDCDCQITGTKFYITKTTFSLPYAHRALSINNFLLWKLFEV